MTFWSDETLEARLPKLISPYSHSKVSCASYELHVGTESYVTPVYDAKLQERTKRRLSKGDSIVIPKGQFAFLITDEIVKVPEDAVAFISIKAKIKFRGLINVSGFHVDPGYSGRLVFSVYNAGGGDVLLDCGGAAFLIWYASLDKPSSKPKTTSGYESIPSEMIHGLNNDIFSLPTFDARLKEVEKSLHKLKAYFGVALAAFSMFIGMLTFGFRIWDQHERNTKTTNPASTQGERHQTQDSPQKIAEPSSGTMDSTNTLIKKSDAVNNQQYPEHK